MIRLRSDWEEPGFEVASMSPPRLNAALIDTTVIHWTGIEDPADANDDQIIGLLRSMQRDYCLNRGYSLGYSWLVDPRGQAWEIRGADYQPAANSGHNSHTLPIVVTAGGHEPVTDAAWVTIRHLSADAEHRSSIPYRYRPVPHRELSGASTACPGDTIANQIAAGDGDLPAPSEPVKETLNMFIFRSTFYADQFLVGGGAVHLGPTMLQFLEDLPVFVNDDPDQMRYVCAAAGFDFDDLTPL